MVDPQEQFEQLIHHLSTVSGHDFSIHNNACTLFNEHNEIAVVIELPESSDLLLLHSNVSQLPSDPDVRNGRALQLLALNSNPSQLRGAWFSIDSGTYEIHLMTSSPIISLTKATFENMLLNFIQLADNLTAELSEEERVLSNESPPPAPELNP